ncbi:MAG: TIR domain-containing protein, partial [Deferribacteres bacterium]|nr:TIR domain-containing protein [Deferribacteres bacterium]
HTDWVRALAFSSDGNIIASASDDNTVRLWDVNNYKEIALLKGHTYTVYSVAFSSDRNTIASASADNTVRLWDANNHKEIVLLIGHTNWVRAVAFSSDGNTIVSASSDNTVRLWDANNHKEIARLNGHTKAISSVVFSSSGNTVASASDDQTIRFWNTKTHKEIAQLKGHNNTVRAVAFSNNGNTIASASDDHTIRLWNLKRKNEIVQLNGHTKAVLSVAFSNDENTIISASDDKTIRLWDVKTHKEITQLNGHTNTVWSVAISSDGNTIASASDDKTVRLWDVKTHKEIAQLKGHTSYVRAVAFSSDGNTIASASDDNTVRLWDTKTHKEIVQLKGHTSSVRAVAFSNDGNTIASASSDETVRLWETKNYKEIAQLKGHTSYVRAVAFSSDGNIVASASDDETVVFYNVDWISSRKIDAVSEIANQYCSAKVVLVGDSGRGKTCLARALMGEPFEPQESTHGMKVWEFESESVQNEYGGELQRDTLLWDLAGQADYQVVHQLFLDKTSLALLLFDPADPNNPFAGVDFWAKSLSKVAGESCPRLLVAGRVDRGHISATDKEIKDYCKRYNLAAYIATSAKTHVGVEELKQEIAAYVPWGDLPVTSSPEIWERLREYLIQRRQGADILSRRADLLEAFRQSHKDGFISVEEFDTVVGHAQAQGLLWRLSFGDFVLLKPELLNDYASAIVRVARKHSEGLGCVKERDILEASFNFEDMQRIEDRETERSLLHATLELCLEREVALREGEVIVFPSKFNRTLPDIPEPPVTEVAYRFEGPVEDIYATLVVRLFYAEIYDGMELYRNASVFKDMAGKQCGFQLEHPEEGSGLLSIFFEKSTDLPSKVLFLRFIHEHLFRRALDKSLQRERIYRCPDCGEQVVNEKAIAKRLESGKATIPCQYCDTAIPLFDMLEEKFGDEKLLVKVREMDEAARARREDETNRMKSKGKISTGEFDVFLCHNSEDKPAVRQLYEDLQKEGISPWLDEKELRPGLPWQDALEAQIARIKSAAVIVGENGIGPWHHRELNAFLRQFVKRSIPVIPVLLENASTEPELPIFLEDMTWVDFRRTKPDPMQRLVWGITGENPNKRDLRE